MRKPKGTQKGNLVKLVPGNNFLARKLIPRYLWGITPGHLTPRQEDVVVFHFDKPCKFQFSTKFPAGTIGMILAGKRTRVRRGSLPYYILLINKNLYKIDVNCVEYIDQNNLINC